MRVLLSTVGSRGDVQPMAALAWHLRDLGHDAHICAPPGFDAELDGLPYVRIGHNLRRGARRVPGGATATVANQFAVLGAAAAGCDAVVGCAALQIATRSIAEVRGIPYFYTAYAPVCLPSPHHPPPPVEGPPRPKGLDNSGQWRVDARWWNETWLPGLNAQRSELGLPPLADVRSHVLSDRPLLAADPTLAPWPAGGDLDVDQTGVWLRDDRRPLPREVQAFLDAGDPPILLGMGSIRAPRITAAAMLTAVRRLGRRAILLRGWAGLAAADDSPDWMSVGETNLQALLGRVAAIVHHGGSGTTTQALRAGVPQVVIPHYFDQPYFADRITALGAGVRAPEGDVGAEALCGALEQALTDGVGAQARSLAAVVRTDGTDLAARLIAHS